MLHALQETIFQVAAQKKLIIYRSFLVVYIGILAILLSGSIAIVRNNPSFSWFYDVGVWFGRVAVTILAVVLVPGILGRFGIQIKVTRVITFYRRQLGITTFILAFTHGMLVRIVLRLSHGQFPFVVEPLFELFGVCALSLLFFLFVTSNDTSVRRMGPWWKRLHRLIYIIVWLVLFHTVLQRVSVWSVMIGTISVVEVISLIYRRFRNDISGTK